MTARDPRLAGRRGGARGAAMKHETYVNPRWIKQPHDCQFYAACTSCDWREDTVTYEQALFLAARHKRQGAEASA
jgi:hypothetical protein